MVPGKLFSSPGFPPAFRGGFFKKSPWPPEAEQFGLTLLQDLSKIGLTLLQKFEKIGLTL